MLVHGVTLIVWIDDVGGVTSLPTLLNLCSFTLQAIQIHILSTLTITHTVLLTLLSSPSVTAYAEITSILTQQLSLFLALNG